ncbi:GNAT family N-acetyltransferase [Pengzhenrongella frigida]|uniref:GNAT family N-acetyltransferase n=1 Tax=Pengzhenrongella frigida TaxID=1259133 RepID=A0A4Q5MXF5_9MICO|nr:GNAT family N-acetyltransferase [Cellulomonas sp. HLT2-17]RYV50338.1 GNAT family N-acetyltransferase [Cellulomonas sp. HLT2-17]
MAGPDDVSSALGASYPGDWEADVVLRDGATAHLRPIAPTDADALQAFHVGQSERSTYLRFFAPLQRLSERDLARFTNVDHRDRVALIIVQDLPPDPGVDPAGAGPREQIIGVGRYDRIGPDEAEIAFNIADAHHGRGLGSVLLEHLAAAARERGVRRFTAEVLPQNGRMIAVFREAGFDVSQTVDDGVVTVSFDIDPTDRSLAVMADREHRAEARSVQGLLGARSVLLIGQPDAIAGSAVDLLFRRGFESVTSGGFDVVHVLGAGRPADGDEGGAVRYWARLEDVPGPVDLAVVALPASQVVAVVRQFAPLSIRGIVVLSTGFAETGAAGLALQRALVRTAHAGGMRLVGPASYGFFSATVEPPVNASLAERLPPPGNIGLFCQSAPMAVPILASVEHRALGVSSFFSSGHRADVSGNDLMQFWHEDPATQVVGMVLESIGNPRKFSRIARRLAAVKPVVVVTAGQSGHVVPPGHAVRATRSPRRTLEEMFRQSGVIRAQNTHRMLDIVQLVAHQPLPSGDRVGIVAGSSSLAALVAEAAAAAGLDHEGRVVMVTEDTDDVALNAAIRALYADGSCDVVVAVHVPTVGAASPRLAHAVATAAAGSGVTTVACVLGLHGVTAALTAVGPVGPVAAGDPVAADGSAAVGDPGPDPDSDSDSDSASAAVPEPAAAASRPWTVPAYSTPEAAVAALGAVVQYAAWRAVDRGRLVRPLGTDRPRARALVRQHLPATLGTGPVDLAPAVAVELVACYGIEVWAGRIVATADEAVAAAEELGWPVALKSTSPLLRHRADLGGVRLDIADPDELRVAVEHLFGRARQIGAAGVPLEVQRMAPSGVACVVRSAEDPLFGPVVSFGLAGDAVDLLGDIAYGIPPLTDVDVADLVRSARAAPRLFGYRGLPSADVAALEDVIARVSVMAADLPELRSLELHPVVVGETGAAVLSVTVQLEEATRADGTRRALPA